jgi:hypothetical protein
MGWQPRTGLCEPPRLAKRPLTSLLAGFPRSL